MQIDSTSVWSDVRAIKTTSPLIHNITNYVVMESSANGLLAIGASPFMAHAIEEIKDITKNADALVINLGTLSSSWIPSILVALKTASFKKIPVILDPVGIGATTYRTHITHTILSQGKISIIRGNTSEISWLAGGHRPPKGVDSLLVTTDCRDQAKLVALTHHCIVWMSGVIDIVTDGTYTIYIHNGHPLMSKVTGMGCMATALAGAFTAVNQQTLVACAHTAILMGITGEIASENCKGPGTFKLKFIDALYHLSLDQIEKFIRVEIL